MTKKTSLGGIGYIVLSSFVFSLAATFATFAADEGSNAVGTLIARFTFAAITAMVARIVVRRRVPWPSRRTCIELMSFGGVGYFLGALLYFTALERIDSSLAIVLFNCYPLFVVALSWMLFHQRPTPAVIGTLTLTLLGVGITAGEVGSGDTLAVVLCIGSALLYTTYSLGSSRSLTRTDVLTGTALVMTGAAISFWLFWLIAGSRITVTFPDTTVGWGWIILMGTITTIGGTACFFAGMNRIGASKASIVSTSEPVMAIVAGVVFLGESLSFARVVGAILVISALLLLAVLEKRSVTPVVSQ